MCEDSRQMWHAVCYRCEGVGDEVSRHSDLGSKVRWCPSRALLSTRAPLLSVLCCSDSTLLMADCFQVLRRLKHLIHLSLSRCYQIHLAALT